MNVKRTLIGSPGSGGFRGGVFTMLGPRIRRRFSLNRSNMALGSLSGSGVGVFSVLMVQMPYARTMCVFSPSSRSRCCSAGRTSSPSASAKCQSLPG